MKQFRYMLTVMMLLVSLCVTAQAGQLSWQPEGQPYSILLSKNEDGETLTILGFDNSTDWQKAEANGLILPTEVNGKTVTAIADHAFWYEITEELSPVTLPGKLVTIGDRAFYSCYGLGGPLVIPDTVKNIGDEAFYGCNIESLDLGEGVETIGMQAFMEIAAQGSLVIPDSVRVIGEKAFYACTDFDGTLILGNGVERIEDSAFYECNGFTGDLTLPESLETLGTAVFANCSGLNGKLTLNASLSEIPASTFQACGFTGNLTLPNTITSIGDSAFYECKNFTGALKIPYDVTEIGKHAFYGCNGFTELDLGESLTELQQGTFYGCSGLTGTVEIPDSVTRIGAEAFYFCAGINGLELPSDLAYIGYKAFRSCRSLEGKIALPDGVVVIGEYAFEDCGDLAISPVMPSNLIEIGDGAFNGMENMKGQLSLPESLEHIGAYAFAKTGLTGDVIIPPGVATLGGWAFSECVDLNGTVRLPYGITGSSRCLFKDCEKISEAWIPTDLPSEALLYGFHYTTVVYYGGTEEQWQARDDEPSVETIYYESYPAKGLNISGGSTQRYPVGQEFTLEAKWYSDEPNTDPSFTWSTTAPDVFQLENTTVEISPFGYSAQLTATFKTLKEGTTAIHVSGPDNLSDSIQAIATDLKTLEFLPISGQSTKKVNPVAVDESTTFTFRYTTSGIAFDEREQIEWTVEEISSDSTEESSVIRVDSVYTSNDETSSIDLTMVVYGVTAGAPMNLVLKGPGGCTASVPVVVPADKIIILDKDGYVPSGDENPLFQTKVGEAFVLKIRYESMADEEIVAETLREMAFTLTAEDFFVQPDDLQDDAIVELRGSLDAYPVTDMTYKKIADGAYVAQYTFTPALEGATVLTAATGDYAEDYCVVLSTFDIATYRAYLYHSTDANERTAADGIKRTLEGETPATIILDELQKRGFAVGAVLWDAVQALFETSQDPNNLYDLVIREPDIYYALLLEVLQVAMEESVDINARTFMQYSDDFVDGISDVLKVVYDADLDEIDDLNGIVTDEQKKMLLEDLTIKAFSEKYKGLETASEIINMCDIMAIGVETVADFEKRLSSAAVLAGMTESMETVLRQMLAECSYYENMEALEYALEECLRMVGATKEELLLDVSMGTLLATGHTAAGKLLEKVWERMMDQVKITHPAVAAVYAAYYSGTTVSNALFSTDDTLEEYYKMAALQDIKVIARAAHDTLSEDYVAFQDTASAEAYLNAIDLLFRIQLQDCDQALDYVDVLDNSVWNIVTEVFGDDTTDDAMEIIRNFRNTIQTQQDVAQMMWIDYVGYTYPGTQLQNVYQKAYEAALGLSRRVVVACPVEVFVEDASGNAVAHVTETSVYSSVDDISVMLDGEEKTIDFLNGADYTLRIVGTETGTMDITDTRYENDMLVRTLEYHDLDVTEGGEYQIKRFNNLTDAEDKKVVADADSREEAAYTLTLMSAAADGLEDGKARAGQRISIAAVIPEGYEFAGWNCDHVDVAFADPENPITTFQMPAANVTVTAQLKIKDALVPENRFTLSDEEGFVLREIPHGYFTLRVAGEGVCLLATYDVNGKMLSAQMLETMGGLITAQLSNANDTIEHIALFWVESMENPRPRERVLELTAK